MRAWVWHLVNDPVSDNPWSFALLVLTVAALFASLWFTDGWRRLPWATLRREQPDREEQAVTMPTGHRANESDQFTPLNTTGQTAGLPVAEGYPHRDAADQAPLVNPSAGTQGPPGGGVNPK